MNKEKIWYRLVRNNGKWTVWKHTELMYKDHGGWGQQGIFSSESKKECLEYIKEHNIVLKKGR
jgi:uncharacterized protein YbdZ (MbtH family)